MIDKLGRCPHCGYDWNGGFVLDNLRGMEAFMNKSNTVVKNIASRAYGFSEENQNSFTKTTVREIEVEDKTITLVECPNMRCGHLFDIETEQEYASYYDFQKAYNLIPDEKENTNQSTDNGDNQLSGGEHRGGDNTKGWGENDDDEDTPWD